MSFRKHRWFVNPSLPVLEELILLIRFILEGVILMLTESLHGSRENLRDDSTLFFFFLNRHTCAHLWHLICGKWVSRPAVELKLQLPACATATATLDPSHICSLCSSLCNATYLTHWTRPWIELTTSQTLCQLLNPLSHSGNSSTLFLNFVLWTIGNLKIGFCYRSGKEDNKWKKKCNTEGVHW